MAWIELMGRFGEGLCMRVLVKLIARGGWRLRV